jgi:hypothetical protein
MQRYAADVVGDDALEIALNCPDGIVLRDRHVFLRVARTYSTAPILAATTVVVE